jgi:hypothetical protein
MNKMRKILRFNILFATAILALTACERPENNDPNGNEVNNNPIKRVIVYTIGNHENRQTLETDGEWDTMLDMLCSEAQRGNQVTFYNMNQTTYLQAKGLDGAKGAKTFSTTSSAEMKAWMRKMEEEGRTVVVTYGNGTWNGTAYATAPSTTTSSTIIGTWHFSRSVVNHIGPNSLLISSDLYVPEDDGGSMYYTFYDNGTMTLIFNGMDGTTATDNSTWTITGEGNLHCELLPNSGIWNVNWITDNSMIISRSDVGTEEGDILYQLQFDRE